MVYLCLAPLSVKVRTSRARVGWVFSRSQLEEGVMDRRKILLVLAAVIAALGTLLVFLYVQGADDRAKEDIEAVEVLKVIKPIEAGETFDDAQAAGKDRKSTRLNSSH